jgi:hypothetical protein
MVRDAQIGDIPALLAMVERLREAASVPIPFNRGYTQAYIKYCINSPDGLALVLERDKPAGMLIARLMFCSISSVPIAAEQGWWVEPEARGSLGAIRLLQRFETWARRHECFAVKMSTIKHDDAPAMMLGRLGYAIQETAWAKVL